MQTPGAIAGALATLVVHGLPDDYYPTLRRPAGRHGAGGLRGRRGHLRPEGITLVVEGDAR